MTQLQKIFAIEIYNENKRMSETMECTTILYKETVF